MRGSLTICLGLMLAAPLSAEPTQPLKLSSREYREAVKAMGAAVEEFHVERFLDAFATVLSRNDSRCIKDAADGYGRLLAKAAGELSARRFYVLHGRAAKSFSDLTSPRALKEMRRLQKSHGRWRSRLLLLDAASFNAQLNVRDSALVALNDKEPAVVLRSLAYLSRSKTRVVVEALIDRYLKVSRARKGEKDPAWSRAELAFQAALTRLLGVELPAAEDYDNYLKARSDDDLFKPPASRPGARTELTLFGASVTGRNIAFILDTSGSMLTTDRVSDAAKRKRSGRTGVADPRRPRLPPVERQRMVRAKKELSKVVNALPEGVSFNVIAFSSGVEAWSDQLVQALPKNKKKALRFIDSMVASGITVMDLALEEALADLSVDTIYLITDGAPTHIGSQGGLPPDAPELMKSILRRMKAMNFLRGVRIFTLGFRGAEEEFLEELSSTHSGKYVRID